MYQKEDVFLFCTPMKEVLTMKKNLKMTVFILLCVILAILFANNFRSISNGHMETGSGIGTTTTPAAENNAFIQNQDILDWNLILVNEWNYIPKNYNVTLMTLKNNYQIDERIYPDLQEMFDAARNEGIYPLIGEAYRTSNDQQSLYTNKVNAYIAKGYSEKEAKELAKAWVALPGTSEHQLGLALDINAEKDKCTNDEVYKWLYENSYKYGFIMRYPSDKVEITGVNYEPWHYRYVGREAAEEIYKQGICFEEYLDSLK